MWSVSSSTCTSEVNVYLNTAFEFASDDFNLQHWWRDHEKIFPILAIITKQIFRTPVSTVLVEQEFSTGDNVLNERRSLLSPNSIQIQVCVDDCTKAQHKQQEMDGPSDDNNDDTTATKGTSDD
ncbi:hypothetical protein ACOSQ2_029852 [Xanthoceras sorbifolium]